MVNPPTLQVTLGTSLKGWQSPGDQTSGPSLFSFKITIIILLWLWGTPVFGDTPDKFLLVIFWVTPGGAQGATYSAGN